MLNILTIALLTASAAAATPLLARDSNLSNTTGLNASFNSTSNNNTALRCNVFMKTFSNVVSSNPQLRLPVPSGAMAVGNLVTDLTSVNSNFTAEYLSPNKNTTGTYDIYMQYCEPASGPTKPAVLELIHGINFDHSYWCFEETPGVTNYNFVQAAANAGYATLAYDRLGVGKSSKPDGINVTQSPTEVEIAAQIAMQLRAGTLVPDTITRPASKVVAIGHSFGSAQSHQLATLHPNAIDAVVLTGYSTSGEGVPLFLSASVYAPAREVDPVRFGNYSNEYLLSGGAQGDRQLFFYNGGYSEKVFRAGEAARQTVTLGELLTLGGPINPPKNATNFRGDTLVVTGSHDLVFCAGGCYRNGTNIPAQLQALYPNAKSFTTYIPAFTGHALNLHYSAPEQYTYILNWISSKGN